MTLACILKGECNLHNQTHQDLSNGYRPGKIFHDGKILGLKVPATRLHSSKPMILGVLKDQREGVKKLNPKLRFLAFLTGEQIGDVCEELYGKNYSKSYIR